MDVSETNIITVDRPADFIWPGFADAVALADLGIGRSRSAIGALLRAGLRRDE